MNDYKDLLGAPMMDVDPAGKMYFGFISKIEVRGHKQKLLYYIQWSDLDFLRGPYSEEDLDYFKDIYLKYCKEHGL